MTARADFYNFKARYYDPEYEHFLTRDPILSDFTPYNYCYGNPINFIDYTGLLGTFWYFGNPNKKWFYKHNPNYFKIDAGNPYGPTGAIVVKLIIIPIWNQTSQVIYDDEWGEGVGITGWYTYEVFERYNLPEFEDTWAGGGSGSDPIEIVKSGYGIGAAIYGVGSTVARQIKIGNIRSYNPRLAIKSGRFVSKVAIGINIVLYTSDLAWAYHKYGWNMFSKYEFWHPTAQFAGGIIGAVGGGFLGAAWVSVGTSFLGGQFGSWFGGMVVDKAYGR